MVINGYKLKAELKNANSGFSKWGFATKNGKEYFIKELITPVFPIDRTIMSDEMYTERIRFCANYENKFKVFFDKINAASNGTLIRIENFFRSGGRYYIITEKVKSESVSMGFIASFSEKQKILLLKTAAYCFCNLHKAGIVHFDVKPSNIMIKMSKNGNYIAKAIDFDSGFTKGDILKNDELGGDLTYLAPETFLAIAGEGVTPDEKADIFALGLLFHQYWCGSLPPFDKAEYEYPYESALDTGSIPICSAHMPESISELISSMLDVKPSKRPSAEEVMMKLNIGCEMKSEPDEGVKKEPAESGKKGSEWFAAAGDL